ncbi:MAG: sigma-54 dependent transcriptional regulator [Prevotellaceae bacterium]|jgi:transcriptional regulator with PAS, ATPase and Fis domain|nr:sigma-54 dependent transcriptional regulator [Prevotellaceae bacterium]
MQNSEIQSAKQRFGIIGSSELLNRAVDIAIQVAPTDLSVLITGESGVGKESFPQITHQYSHRKHGPYIAVNCGAIPEGTIDSELFGHEKGAFTGATSERKGYFEVADGGTIFLDEVGELPLSTQVRLLRVLETGEFIKVGSSKTQKTDVRVVAATNLNMSKAIQDGRFREDLFYRLNTVPIHIPPLRERRDDIVLLFRKFALDFAEKYRMPPIKLTDDAQVLLANYYWKGNVRQLKNITEQISVIEQQRDISSQTLRLYLPQEEMERLPALPSSHGGDEKNFTNEREILYQVLFDMRKDINDLKKMVYDTIDDKTPDSKKDEAVYPAIFSRDAIITPAHHNVAEAKSEHVDSKRFAGDHGIFQDAEYHEDDKQPMTLEEMEKQMIKRTLDKYRGKRRQAAEELKISERTLYRKIKEYGIE